MNKVQLNYNQLDRIPNLGFIIFVLFSMVFTDRVWAVTATEAVSKNNYGTLSIKGVESDRPAISVDGRVIAFVSESSNLVPNDNNQ